MRALLAAAVVAVSGLAAADDKKADKYTSDDGKYAVSFPAKAKVKTATQDAGGLKLNMATAEDAGKAYAVMFMTLPVADPSVIPAKTILDGAAKGAVDKSGGKLTSSKDLEFGKDKHPGREIVVDKDGNKVKTWVIVAGAKVYVVVVGGPKDFATGKDAQAFLDSFELTK